VELDRWAARALDSLIAKVETVSSDAAVSRRGTMSARPSLMTVRIGAVALAALLSAPLVACDKPGEKGQNAEGMANMQAQEARDEAASKAAEAQAEADMKIVAARIDFEKAREAYTASRQSYLADLNQKLAGLDIRERAATGQTKADLDRKLPLVRAQRDAFVADLSSVTFDTAATWDETKARLDKEWDTLEARVDQM